jgi:predicted outer membrane repeat protein
MTLVMTGVFLAALALALLLNSSPALSAEPVTQIVYVDADAAAGGSGQSWGTAYRTLQDALDEANAHGSNSYEIWVAEGVYTPDEDDDGDHIADVVTETFHLNYNNVQLYGGFAGGETTREQRDWAANVTVLSGDIDGNDITDARGVVIDAADIRGSNAYHVLWLDGESNEPITGTTTIDGFTITAGQTDSGPEVHVIHSDGGGLYCAGSGSDITSNASECSPTLVNVTFSGNSARWVGGAIFNDGLSDGASSPTLINVTFRGNSAGEFGGAMYNFGFWDGASSPTLTNVTFSGNSAGKDGGAMYNDGRYGASSPTLTNVTFSDNSAGEAGGAMYNDGIYDGASSPTLTNVTFSDNSAWQGGAMYNDGGYDGASSPTLTNVILWGNSADRGGDQMYNDEAAPAIGYSLVEGGWDGSGITNWGSTVTDNGGNIDADPQLVDAEAGNLRLRRNSPAIDAGDNSGIPAGVTTDLDGKPRFVDIPTVADTGSGAPPIVDMGAYEVQSLPKRIYLPLVLRNHRELLP